MSVFATHVTCKTHIVVQNARARTHSVCTHAHTHVQSHNTLTYTLTHIHTYIYTHTVTYSITQLAHRTTAYSNELQAKMTRRMLAIDRFVQQRRIPAVLAGKVS